MPALDEGYSAENNKVSDTVSNLERKLKIYEEERVKSFQTWAFSEDEKCSISEMAKAGFYYIGLSKDDDSVTCFVCGKVLDGWENTDDPWLEHQKHSANCKFVEMRRSEDELTLEEFIDLVKHIIKQSLTLQFHKKEALFAKRIEKIRNVIKTKQF